MPKARSSRPGAAAPRVLVVDDAPDTLELVQRNLTSQGYRVFTASSAADALAILDAAPMDLLVTDIRMPGISGLELIHEARERHPDVEIVVITGYATIEGAVEALQVGAWDYLAKPFTDQELFQAVRRALARRARGAPARGPARLVEFHGLLGRCEAMQALFEGLATAARQDGAVLLRGEPGAGREAAARALHALTGCHGPFVRVSLDAAGAGPGGLPSDVERACAGGTLYLAALDGAQEGALADVVTLLQGRKKPARRGARARLVASVAAGSGELARRGRALTDALRRFGRTLALPPLRERGDDVVLLARRFLAEAASRAGIPARVPDEAVQRALHSYPWPGNVRELRDLASQLALGGGSGPIALGELPAWIAGAAGGATTDLTLAAAEREHIARVLRRTSGNKSRAAEILGIDRKTLRDRLRGGEEP